ncbi:hypothetical protein GGS24DRAFT_443364 [Hypoxylon argillaceum]|nr:hypothetical protein GGS24DRAFT_443364 [Hypoxylon argillaceum]
MKKRFWDKSLSDFHRCPPRPRARRQDRENGVEIITTLYTACARRRRPPSLRTGRE